MAQRPHARRTKLLERLQHVGRLAADYLAGSLNNRDRDVVRLLQEEVLLLLLVEEETVQRIQAKLLAESQPPWRSARSRQVLQEMISWAQFLLSLDVLGAEMTLRLSRSPTTASQRTMSAQSRLSRPPPSSKRHRRPSAVATAPAVIQAKLDEAHLPVTPAVSRAPVDQRPHTIEPSTAGLPDDDNSMFPLGPAGSVQQRPSTVEGSKDRRNSTPRYFQGQQKLQVSTRPTMRSCELCRASFQKPSFKPVIRKHVIQWLRTRGVEQRSRYEEVCVPADLAKTCILNMTHEYDDMAHLLCPQGSALFDFVHVCVFCTQMFDPAFDDGFWHPVPSPARTVTAGHFFDDNYPYFSSCDNAEFARQTEEKRALARRLVTAVRIEEQQKM